MKTIKRKKLNKEFKYTTKNVKKIFGDKNILLSINWFRFDIKIIKNKSKFIIKTKEKNENFDYDKEKSKIKKYKKEIKKTGELKLSFPVKRKDIKTFSTLYDFKIKGIENDKLVLFKIKDKSMITGFNDEELEGSCLFGRYREDDGSTFGRSYKEDEIKEDDDRPTFGKLG